MKNFRNFFHYLKENERRLNLDPNLTNLIKDNIRFTSKTKFQIIEEKYPNFRNYYEEFLESQKFRDLINTIKNKYDYEYVKLFFRHSLNFLHYYLKWRHNKVVYWKECVLNFWFIYLN